MHQHTDLLASMVVKDLPGSMASIAGAEEIGSKLQVCTVKFICECIACILQIEYHEPE